MGRGFGSTPENSGYTFNDSVIHMDFMIGTPDMHIVGTTEDGREIDVFLNGDFAF